MAKQSGGAIRLKLAGYMDSKGGGLDGFSFEEK